MAAFQIISSTRYDLNLVECAENNQLNVENASVTDRLYMFRYHMDRIADAFDEAHSTNAKQWPPLRRVELLSSCLEKLSSLLLNVSSPQKVRILVSCAKSIDITLTPVSLLQCSTLFPVSLDAIVMEEPKFRIYYSHINAKPSYFTRHKTTARSVYDEHRALLPRDSIDGLLDEILLVNDAGLIMEASITTPYFKGEMEWLTPHRSSGGNHGTTRRWALSKNHCQESEISLASVLAGDFGNRVILSNGVRGFGWGYLQRLPQVFQEQL